MSEIIKVGNKIPLVDGKALLSRGITPSGSIEITENDTYDVTQYAEAVVSVSGGGAPARTAWYRPPDFPDLSFVDMTDFETCEWYGSYDTQCEEYGGDPFIALRANAADPNYKTYIVERGKVVDGNYLVTASYNVSSGEVFFELLPKDEGKYVVYHAYVPNLDFRIFEFADFDNHFAKNQPCVETCYKKGTTRSGGDSPLLTRFTKIARVTKGCDYKYNYNGVIDYTEYIFDSTNNSQENIPKGSGVGKHFVISGLVKTYTYSWINPFQNNTQICRLEQHNCSVTPTSINRFCYGATSLVYADLSFFNPDILIQDGNNFYRAFYGCTSLETLNLSNVNLSNQSSGTNNEMFKDCSALTNVITNNKTVLENRPISFAESSLLTDESLINIANALQITAQTITLHATPKGRLATIMGTVADGVFTADESGTVTLENFITQIKGWTIA